MPNYNPSTLARLGDIVLGIRVDTGTMLNATYLAQTQQEIFNVFGTVKILNMFGEVLVAASNDATTVKFNFTMSDPSVGVSDLSAACTTIAQFARGRRIQWLGGTVATAATVTPVVACITGAAAVIPQIVGCNGGTGTIGILSAAASQTSGSMVWSIFYAPMSDGAYVTAAH